MNGQVRRNPRVVTHSRLFWLHMAPAFVGIANEVQIAYTELEGFDVVVRGAWASVSTPRVRLSVGATGIDFSAERVPLSTVAATTTEVSPMKYWRSPLYLHARRILTGNFINVSAETEAHISFFSTVAGSDQRLLITKSRDYYLFVNLGNVATARTSQIDHDLLIWGAITNIASVLVSSGTFGRIFNESTNESWSTDALPLRAMCGIAANTQPIMWYQVPYYLPARVQLRVELESAPGPTAYVAFICERILK